MSNFSEEVVEVIVDAARGEDASVQSVYIGGGIDRAGGPYVIVLVVCVESPRDQYVYAAYIGRTNPDDLGDAPSLGTAIWEEAWESSGFIHRFGTVYIAGSAAALLAELWVDGLPVHEQWGGLDIIPKDPAL